MPFLLRRQRTISHPYFFELNDLVTLMTADFQSAFRVRARKRPGDNALAGLAADDLERVVGAAGDKDVACPVK